jgi:hypothetical protein
MTGPAGTKYNIFDAVHLIGGKTAIYVFCFLLTTYHVSFLLIIALEFRGDFRTPLSTMSSSKTLGSDSRGDSCDLQRSRPDAANSPDLGSILHYRRLACSVPRDVSTCNGICSECCTSFGYHTQPSRLSLKSTAKRLDLCEQEILASHMKPPEAIDAPSLRPEP